MRSTNGTPCYRLPSLDEHDTQQVVHDHGEYLCNSWGPGENPINSRLRTGHLTTYYRSCIQLLPEMSV